MSTRARIGMQHPDGMIRSIYVHSDGYPEHHGPLLLEHYTTAEQVTALLDLGDLSVLAEEIGDVQDFDAQYADDDPRQRWCLAYGRDRGERGVGARDHADVPAFLQAVEATGAEYAYLWRDGAWVVWARRGYAPEHWPEHALTEVVKG